MLRVARRLGRRCRSGSRPPAGGPCGAAGGTRTIPTPGSRPSARRSSGGRRSGSGGCGGRLLRTHRLSLAQTEQVYLAADQYNLAVKGHMDQLSNLGAARSPPISAPSVDHLEYLDQGGNTGAGPPRRGRHPAAHRLLFPEGDQAATCRSPAPRRGAHGGLLRHQPGYGPIVSLRMAMNMACTLFGLTPVEAMTGVTRHAAKALGEQEHLGQLRWACRRISLIWSCAPSGNQLPGRRRSAGQPGIQRQETHHG